MGFFARLSGLGLGVVLAGLVVAAWWWPNRLVNPEQGVTASKFNSLSYTGYRPGESPLTDTFPTAAEVDEDLALLAPITRAVRTYAAVEGPFEVPALAQKHGLKLWQGIWLGGDRAKNAVEMARAIDMAHRYPATIERVIVGNEVLLRRDLPVAELIADIDHVRASVKQPVAYADVSDFWDQFPQIAPHVDVVLIHLLPYWEDVPTGIGRAVDVVGQTYAHFEKLFPGKQIAIGETGWPSRGRQRRDAVPGLVNQARFLRGFMALAAAKHFDYNFIEAFDQDWKYENEGIVGANWGIFTADRQVKIPPQGALREDPSWAWHAGFSVLCGVVLWALGRKMFFSEEKNQKTFVPSPSPAIRDRRLSPYPKWQKFFGSFFQKRTFFLAFILGGALGLAQASTAPVLYDMHVRLAAVVNLGGQALLAGLFMLRLAGAVQPAPQRNAANATRRVLNALRLKRVCWAGLFEDVALLFVWTASVQQVLLVFDPRYREFPVASFAVPLVVTLARAFAGDFRRGTGGREELVLGLVLVGGAVASAVQEGWLNGQSLLWNGCAVVLTVGVWWSLWPGPEGRDGLRSTPSYGVSVGS